jgi:Domain of unknown function (DUF4160)
MPTISRCYEILIQMFFDDQHGPHFHAVYAEYKASIEIGSGKIIVGKLPRHAQHLVLEWAKKHVRAFGKLGARSSGRTAEANRSLGMTGV